MKKSLLLLILLMNIWTLAQQTIFTKAKVKTVDIYTNRAQMKNIVSVNLPTGNVKLVIGNISTNIEDESIQIGSNSKNLSILSSQYTDDYEEDIDLDETNPKIKKYLDSLNLIKNKIEKVKIQLESTKKSVELLDKNQGVLIESNASNVAQLSNLTDFYGKKRIELLLKAKKLKQKLNKLTKDNQRISDDLRKTESRYEEELGDGVLVLQISNQKAGKVIFNINYLAYNANWYPLYEIRGNQQNNALEISLQAAVKQDTGLDWKNVKLTIINSRYRRNNTAPKMNPWILSYTTPEQRQQQQRQYSQKNYRNADFVVTKEIDSAVIVGYQSNNNTLNTSYEANVQYDILSNNKDHLIPIKKENIPAEFTYYTAPSLEREAFLVANVKNFTQYDLISARAKIIFEGMYVGETRLNTNQTNDNLRITMGNTPRVSVQKIYVKKNKSGKFLSNNQEKLKSYDLVISNKKKEKINIEIQDRFPISENKDIKVELLESSGAKIDKEKHILTWNKKLKPNETIKFRVSYEIRYPKDFKIHGL